MFFFKECAGHDQLCVILISKKEDLLIIDGFFKKK